MKSFLFLAFMLTFSCLILSQGCGSTPAPAAPAAPSANCSVRYGEQTPQPTPVAFGSGLLISQMVDIPLSVTAKSINFHTGVGGSADFTRVAIYTDNAGVPGTKVVESASSAVMPSVWNNIALPDTTLAAGTYWIGFIFQTGQMIDMKGSGGFYYYASPVAYGTLPSSFPAGTGGVGKISLNLGVCQ